MKGENLEDNLELCNLVCARISAYACEGQMTHFFEGRVK